MYCWTTDLLNSSPNARNSSLPWPVPVTHREALPRASREKVTVTPSRVTTIRCSRPNWLVTTSLRSISNWTTDVLLWWGATSIESLAAETTSYPSELAAATTAALKAGHAARTTGVKMHTALINISGYAPSRRSLSSFDRATRHSLCDNGRFSNFSLRRARFLEMAAHIGATTKTAAATAITQAPCGNRSRVSSTI